MLGLIAALAVLSSLCIVAMSLTFCWVVARRFLNQQQDTLDRLQEMIGHVHAYQVDVNHSRVAPLHQPAAFGEPGAAPTGASTLSAPPPSSLHVSEWEEDALALAKRDDGTIDHDMVKRLLAEAEFDNQEIPLR